MPNEKAQEKALSAAEQKELVARFAVDDLVARGLLKAGMKLGLGTGSTAMPAVRRIAELMHEGVLAGIRAVPTSFQTTIACEALGIPSFSMNAREIGGSLDLAIDGADEATPEGHLIKGGGAALLLEKIVAYNAARFVIVADSSKAVAHLGTGFALPVEVIAEARVSVTAALTKLGATVVLREGLRKAGPVVTDNGNLILDCRWQPEADGLSPIDPAEMEETINRIVGVVENGFFTKNPPIVYAARNDGTVETRI